MSKMSELYTQYQDSRHVILASSKKTATKKQEAPVVEKSEAKTVLPTQVRTYYQAVKKLTNEVGNFFMHYKLSLDLDETAPSPDSIRVFMEKHNGSRDVLSSKISDARTQCKFAFENVRFWTKELGKPLTKEDSDGRNLLNMLCVVGKNGTWDMETAKLRRERFRTIARRQLKKSDADIEFLSPYDLEEEFSNYLDARKKRLLRAKARE